jgi:branched-chain amino acid transport system substrate-binding protein
MKTSTFWRTIMGITVFALAAALVFATTAPSQAAGPKEVKIGNILPQSGPSASVGIQNKQAIELATEKINAAGGIKALGGAKLVNTFTDSKGDPNVGVTAAEQLINSNKVSIISGRLELGGNLPSTQVAERYQVPTWSRYPMPTNHGRGFKYTFRIAAKDSWWAETIQVSSRSRRSSRKPSSRPWPFVYENGDWVTGMAKQWDILAKKYGYKFVLERGISEHASDLTPLVAMKVKTKKPDASCSPPTRLTPSCSPTPCHHKVQANAVQLGTGGAMRPVLPEEHGQELRVHVRRGGVGDRSRQAADPDAQRRVQEALRL